MTTEYLKALNKITEVVSRFTRCLVRQLNWLTECQLQEPFWQCYGYTALRAGGEVRKYTSNERAVSDAEMTRQAVYV